jgi:hypothetical protein
MRHRRAYRTPAIDARTTAMIMTAAVAGAVSRTDNAIAQQ